MVEYRYIDRHASNTEDVVELSWVASLCGDFLHWQLRRLLPSVGLVQSGKSTSPHIVIRQSMDGLWRRAFTKLGEDMSLHVAKSSKSQKQSGGAPDEDVHAWCTTKGLFVILLAWMHGRREKKGKEMSGMALQLFLAGTTR